MATANSIARPSRMGIAILKTMIAAPTASTVSVWPSPHTMPTRLAAVRRRSRLTMVVTAITWSGSVACRIPISNPSKAIPSGAVVSKFI